MSLPSIDDREYVLARAFRTWLNTQLGDQQELSEEEKLARYGHMRVHRLDLLKNLAGEERKQSGGITVGVAYTHFFSKVCSGCGGEKPRGKYWICNGCWKRVPREIKEHLIKGWRQEDVPWYEKALEHLAGLRAASGEVKA